MRWVLSVRPFDKVLSLVLKAVFARRLGELKADAFDGGASGGNGGETRDALLECGAADDVGVGHGGTAIGGVDDEVDLAMPQ